MIFTIDFNKKWNHMEISVDEDPRVTVLSDLMFEKLCSALEAKELWPLVV